MRGGGGGEEEKQRRRRCFCAAEGSDAKAWLARPFSPLVSSSWLHLTSGLSDGVTDGGRPLCLQTRSPNDVSDVAKNWFRCQVSVARNDIPLRALAVKLGGGLTHFSKASVGRPLFAETA